MYRGRTNPAASPRHALQLHPQGRQPIHAAALLLRLYRLARTPPRGVYDPRTSRQALVSGRVLHQMCHESVNIQQERDSTLPWIGSFTAFRRFWGTSMASVWRRRAGEPAGAVQRLVGPPPAAIAAEGVDLRGWAAVVVGG